MYKSFTVVKTLERKVFLKKLAKIMKQEMLEIHLHRVHILTETNMWSG